MILDSKKVVLFRFILFASSFAMFGSCSQHSDEDIGNFGYRLVYNNRPSEVVKLNCNIDRLSEIDMADLNLVVNVTCSLNNVEGYNSSQSTIPGNKMIEQQMVEMLDPNKNLFNGVMPVQIEYRTEECKSVHVFLYNKYDEKGSDLTNMARFGQLPRPIDWLGMDGGILICSDGNLVGKIPEGSTIAAYLAYHPMVFASALFIFPHVNKDLFTEGCYIKVEIELADRIICASTKD